MANSNFYDNLDLKYPEIAICIDKIDRINPGTKNFYIPVLTPNVDTSSLKKKVETVYQDNSILENDQKIKINNIKVQNYIPIAIPKELCSISNGGFYVSNIDKIELLTDNGKIWISEVETEDGGAGDSSHSHRINDNDGKMIFQGNIRNFKGNISLTPVSNSNRYIAAGSKWIVVFIGGDINKPQIIGRYTE